ncbi:MAG TPA: hypothetical protein EYO31_06500 [Phycisphaerales bacterium]|jgi:uncharacterized membrane protein HdeD (DUF308 family)|nr:hypothetical protein [Phycisphaerales bacterium]
MIKWKWFFVEGFILFLLGIFAIARPGIAAEALVELFGWLLIFLGVLSVLGGATSQSGPRKPVSLGGGSIAIVLGLVFLILPAPTLALMTVLIAVFFLLSGFVEITSSFALRSTGGQHNHWGLAFFNGIIGIMLGVLLLSMWPDSFEVIGLLLGINFLLSGAYLFSLGWFFRHAPSH